MCGVLVIQVENFKKRFLMIQFLLLQSNFVSTFQVINSMYFSILSIIV